MRGKGGKDVRGDFDDRLAPGFAAVGDALVEGEDAEAGGAGGGRVSLFVRSLVRSFLRTYNMEWGGGGNGLTQDQGQRRE